MVRVHELQKGDMFSVAGPSPAPVGEKYMNYPAKIVEIYYTSKKWWQFWKKREQTGYRVLWEGND